MHPGLLPTDCMTDTIVPALWALGYRPGVGVATVVFLAHLHFQFSHSVRFSEHH